MSETRFILCQDDFGNYEIWDDDKVFHFLWEVAPILNEQQATIDEQKIIIEERDVANERLNRFLIEIGLEKEYIKWEFKKRCVE